MRGGRQNGDLELIQEGQNHGFDRERGTLIDPFGRAITYVRVSVTDDVRGVEYCTVDTCPVGGLPACANWY